MDKESINKVKKWIAEERNAGASWENLLLAGEESQEDLVVFLQYNAKKHHWPNLTIEEWTNIVEQERQKSAKRENIIDKHGASLIGGSNENNTLTVPKEEDSAWQTYRRRLLKNGFGETAINIIERDTLQILRYLSRDTREIGPIKGLVVGNVQSGKTANMAALMAMAADHGWNMFVILSGMMENLRLQTQRRLISDLQDSKLDWESISNPRPVEEFGKRLSDKKLGIETNKRYLSVCIKNSKRLENLIGWLQNDQSSKENIRMLVIDDECDQASINTSKAERKRINELILNLINDRTPKGKATTSVIQCVNYIGYTATPYANVLNEPPGDESLYPKDFISALKVSDKYFGPQQIFGYDGEEETETPNFPGLDIVRIIPDNDVSDINDIQDGIFDSIPYSLQRAVCWFICGVAEMRLSGYKKPVSMLVHTSLKVEHHNHMALSINQWLSDTPKSRIIDLCKRVWDEETSRFTERSFVDSYPSYAATDGGADIMSYHSFESLTPLIVDILTIGLTRILVNDDSHREYTNGLHLCIDNSEKDDEENVIKRLVYPEGDEMPEMAPAFLVIGGNTLSRGLTLEGLISTYFLRPTRCADTLMQMGRWFGYRPGYELLPRIWMTQDIKSKFEFISEMDQKLRDEIEHMAKIEVSPADFGPKILASPSAKWLEIVARNKRQSAIGAEYDFAGHTIETGVFDNVLGKIKRNMEVVRKFLLSIGKPFDIRNNPYADRNIVWKGVPWDSIKTLLKDYTYASKQRGFKELDAFSAWMDKMYGEGLLSDWNVILAGVKNSDAGRWELVEGMEIKKVNRTSKNDIRPDGVINIGVLRSFNDFLSDIELLDNDEELLNKLRSTEHKVSELNNLREQLGLQKTPQLVIYIIDKDSQPQPGATKRFPLNAVHDIAGFSINIPGYRKNRSLITHVTIDLNKSNEFTNEE